MSKSNLPNRQSIRLKNWDYTRPGFYFITLVTKDRKYRFGRICQGEIHLNELGYIVLDCWKKLPHRFKNCKLDEFIIMPDHIHGIIEITATEKTAATVGEIVGAFKSLCHHECLKWAKQRNPEIQLNRFWHRNYYEKIMWTERQLMNTRRYIINNPKNW